MGSAKEHVFYTVAAIALYDRNKAETLLDDVAVNDAAAFFRALVALHPEQVWNEYQEFSGVDSRGTDFRIYVRNDLLPALTKRTDSEFGINSTIQRLDRLIKRFLSGNNFDRKSFVARFETV